MVDASPLDPRRAASAARGLMRIIPAQFVKP
jgi:hypothetical protein